MSSSVADGTGGMSSQTDKLIELVVKVRSVDEAYEEASTDVTIESWRAPASLEYACAVEKLKIAVKRKADAYAELLVFVSGMDMRQYREVEYSSTTLHMALQEGLPPGADHVAVIRRWH